MLVQPYLSFDGRCEEAVAYYRRVLGAEIVALVRFKAMPEPRAPGMVTPENAEKVMHMAPCIGETMVLAWDGLCLGKPDFKGFCLSLTAKIEAEQAFAALSDGGRVQTPLAKTFFSSRFGMMADRFGVNSMVYVEA